MNISKTIVGALLSCLVLFQGAVQPAHSSKCRIDIAAVATGGTNTGAYSNGADVIGSTQGLSSNTVFGGCPEYAYDFSIIYTNGEGQYTTGVNLPSLNSVNCNKFLDVRQFTGFSMSYLPASQVNEDSSIYVALKGCPPCGGQTTYYGHNSTPTAQTNCKGQLYFNWTAPLCNWVDANGNPMPCGTTVKEISVEFSNNSSLQFTWLGNFAVTSACWYDSLCPSDFCFLPASCELDPSYVVTP